MDCLTETGEPAVLALRQLTCTPLQFRPSLARICENPAVLAASDTYGAACPPLVCLQGQPSAAALTLLRHLHAQGARLLYHDDFDRGSLRIAAAPPTAPAPLKGTPASAPWDPELAESLADVRI